MTDDFTAGLRRAAEIVRAQAGLYPVVNGVGLAAPSALEQAARAIVTEAGCERCDGTGECARCGGEGGICNCGAPGGYCHCAACSQCHGSGVCQECKS